MILINTPISKNGFDIRQPFCESSFMPSGFQPQTYADTKDKDGFAEPVTPSDTMRLLTAYMRTDILSLVQFAVRELYDTFDQSPIYSVAMALDEVFENNYRKKPGQYADPKPLSCGRGSSF